MYIYSDNYLYDTQYNRVDGATEATELVQRVNSVRDYKLASSV